MALGASEAHGDVAPAAHLFAVHTFVPVSFYDAMTLATQGRNIVKSYRFACKQAQFVHISGIVAGGALRVFVMLHLGQQVSAFVLSSLATVMAVQARKVFELRQSRFQDDLSSPSQGLKRGENQKRHTCFWDTKLRSWGRWLRLHVRKAYAVGIVALDAVKLNSRIAPRAYAFTVNTVFPIA